MTAPDERPRPKRKRTKNGKLRGRPVKRSGAELPPVEPEKSRLERYFVRLRDPGYVLDPATGEKVARRFGPGVPVFEWREPVTGRPPAKDATKLLWIVRAGRVEELERQEKEGLRQVIEGKSALRQVVEGIVGPGKDHNAPAVEQQLRRTLKAMRARRLEFPE